MSGGAVITGWITAFFPYVLDRGRQPAVRSGWLEKEGAERRRILAGKWDPKNKVDGGGVRYGDFTSGLARVPFQWKYLTTELAMEFHGGFVGIAQDPTTLALRPEIGWVIRHVTGSR